MSNSTKTKSKIQPQRREKGSGSILRKGSKFYARIRTKDGGERYSAACVSREAAEQALRRLTVGEIDPKQTPLFRDYFGALIRDPDDEPGPGQPPLPDVYYTDVRGRLSARYDTETWKLYETVHRLRVKDSPVGKARVGLLKKTTIQALIDSIRQERSWGTTRRYGSCIHTVLDEAKADELVKENPADKLNYGKKSRKKAYVLSKVQSVDLPEALFQYSPRLSAMIVTELDGGLRPGEVCGLRAEDLDMPEPNVWGIWVRRAISRTGEVKKVKDDEERLVYLTDDAFEAITSNLAGRQKGYVFQTDEGNPLRPDYLGTQLRRFCRHLQRKLEKEAEGQDGPIPAVPPFTNRGFRRTFATRGVRSGDLKGTQHLLGHASAEMTTDIYAEPEDGAMRKTVEAIQASVGYRGLFAKD